MNIDVIDEEVSNIHAFGAIHETYKLAAYGVQQDTIKKLIKRNLLTVTSVKAAVANVKLRLAGLSNEEVADVVFALRYVRSSCYLLDECSTIFSFMLRQAMTHMYFDHYTYTYI